MKSLPVAALSRSGPIDAKLRDERMVAQE